MFLVYLIYTLFFIAAANCSLRILYEMIQPEGLLDIVFGWQKMLSKLYGGNKAQQLLGKALGDCMRCMSFWYMPMWYVFYYLFCEHVMGIWITDNVTSTIATFFVNWLWLAVFWSVGAQTGFLLLTFKRKQ